MFCFRVFYTARRWWVTESLCKIPDLTPSVYRRLKLHLQLRMYTEVHTHTHIVRGTWRNIISTVQNDVTSNVNYYFFSILRSGDYCVSRRIHTINIPLLLLSFFFSFRLLNGFLTRVGVLIPTARRNVSFNWNVLRSRDMYLISEFNCYRGARRAQTLYLVCVSIFFF